jgi:hypothetical protein
MEILLCSFSTYRRNITVSTDKLFILTGYCNCSLFNHFAGAVVTAFTQRFIITGADLFVYHYMQSNPEEFPPHIIDNIRNYMVQAGHLKEGNAPHACEMEKEKEECKKNLNC